MKYSSHYSFKNKKKNNVNKNTACTQKPGRKYVSLSNTEADI